MNFAALTQTLLLMLLINGAIFSHNETEPHESLDVCHADVSPSLASDYIALRALYLATDGDNWNAGHNWLTASQFLANPTMPSGIDISTWAGVDLSAQGVVRSLMLDQQNLVGALPIEIGDFCAIEVLQLRNNNLNGSIPNSITNLTDLTILELGSNQLTGIIPNGFSAMQKLDRLNLNDNQLSGPIPMDFGGIDSLTYLRLSINLLSGEIPSTLGNLLKLETLLLQDNKLSGDIPDELGNISTLKSLFLNSNLLTGRIPATLGNLNLVTLFLKDNNLYGCYDPNLLNLCGQIVNSLNTFISDGNKFCIPWEDFCSTQVGICGSTANDDEYCFCETVLNLSENPEPERLERASFKISSDDIIDYDVQTSYTAGKQISLTPGFEVLPNVQFEATIEGCEEECEVTEPCDGDPCIHPEYELDSDGNKYVPNQLTAVIPAALGPFSGNADVIKNLIDSIIYYGGFFEYPGFTAPSFLDFQSETSISKCLCDYDIYLYEVNAIYQIDEEGGGIVANTNSSSSQEGISFSLNHYVDASLVGDEQPLPTGGPSFGLNLLNLSSSLPRIAFLDSGVNPNIIPDQSLLGLSALMGMILVDGGCGAGSEAVDTFGWNFVDDNSDVLDTRGHGTTVYLSYLAAMEKLGLNPNDQNSIIVKVLDDCGIGTSYSTACGLQYAAEKGADIINASWGLYTNNFLLQNTVDEISEAGIVLTCSSGNSGEDMSSTPHFPSGYGYPHNKIISLANQVYSPSSGIETVFEVSGLCLAVGDMTCPTSTDDVSLWSGANFRTVNHIFAEPAIEIQDLLNNAYPSVPPLECGVMGTSYAAPIFTAGLLKWLTDNNGQTIVKDHMEFNSVTWTTDKGSFSSFLLNNDMNCN